MEEGKQKGRRIKEKVEEKREETETSPGKGKRIDSYGDGVRGIQLEYQIGMEEE